MLDRLGSLFNVSCKQNVGGVGYTQISSTTLCRVNVLTCDCPLDTRLAPMVTDAVRVPYREYLGRGEMERGSINV